MRKSFITQEYLNDPRPGTLTAPERRHFFGGKMMEIEDFIRIGGSGFDHQLKKLCTEGPRMTPDQSASDTQGSAKWELLVDANRMLTEYLYNELLANNVNQDFRDLLEENLATKRLSDTVLDYVRANLLARYQLTRIVMWARYYDLSGQGPVTGMAAEKLLQGVPIYHQDALPTDAELAPVGATRTPAQLAVLRDKQALSVQMSAAANGKLKMAFKQAKPAQYYTYAYYFDAIFQKV